MHAKFLLPFLVAGALAAPVSSPATEPESSIVARGHGKQGPPKSVYNPADVRGKGKGKRDLQEQDESAAEDLNHLESRRDRGQYKRDVESEDAGEPQQLEARYYGWGYKPSPKPSGPPTSVRTRPSRPTRPGSNAEYRGSRKRDLKAKEFAGDVNEATVAQVLKARYYGWGYKPSPKPSGPPTSVRTRPSRPTRPGSNAEYRGSRKRDLEAEEFVENANEEAEEQASV